jgi:hypothetical protein
VLFGSVILRQPSFTMSFTDSVVLGSVSFRHASLRDVCPASIDCADDRAAS